MPALAELQLLLILARLNQPLLREEITPHILMCRKLPDIVVILSSLDLYQSLLVSRFGVAGNAFILVFAN